MWFNNWPRIKDKEYKGRDSQILHIQDELNETIDALGDSRDHYLEELFDLHHSVDTLIQHETDRNTREYWQEYVIQKNKTRGYYEPR